MPDSRLKTGFGVPFHEAIKAAQQRGVALPDAYYGELQGLARQLAFSIAGLAALDQLQTVRDSLAAKLQSGQTFRQWQKDILESETLDLPPHKLDNIFRTNVQAAYNRGRWERFVQNADNQPYLMYDAINDSRVRPAHLAMDGIIRPVGDPFWDAHAPLNGYRCRCRLISLSESQAKARSGGDKGLNQPETDKMNPDKGWDYNPGKDLLEGVDKAVASRQGKVSDVLLSALDAKLKDIETVGFVPAKTVKQASKWAVDNDLVDYADYAGVKVEVANAFNQSLFEHIRDFPELRKNQEFIGTIQAQYSLWRTKAIDEYMDVLRKNNPGRPDSVLLPYAKKTIKILKAESTHRAHFWEQPGVKGMAVNKKWGENADEFLKSMEKSVNSGWHPTSCNTIKACVDHEMGHQIGSLLGLSADNDVIAAWDRHKENIEVGLSRYGAKNIDEFIAEAWSEYKNNPAPRAISKEIGDLILRRYHEYKAKK